MVAARALGDTLHRDSGVGDVVSCRVIILYTNALIGHGLRSLLARHGEFEVPLVQPKDADLATAVRVQHPDVIIVEGEGLSAGNARALLEAAWGEPRLRVVNIRSGLTQPTVWRAVTVVPQGQESAAEALERVLVGGAETTER
jgi:chemotaxis response regulator CheB